MQWPQARALHSVAREMPQAAASCAGGCGTRLGDSATAGAGAGIERAIISFAAAVPSALQTGQPMAHGNATVHRFDIKRILLSRNYRGLFTEHNWSGLLAGNIETIRSRAGQWNL
jgi:hypothetical protein